MASNIQSFDISLNNNTEVNETELVEVNPNNLTGKNSGYENLNNNENELPLNFESNEVFSELRDESNKSAIINNPLIQKNKLIDIKYRRGNLHTYFYDKNGIPKIVIGPDCKLN